MGDLTTLDIMLHGRQIGTLARLPNEKILFLWSQSYLENSQRDTLSLSFDDEMGDLKTEFNPTGPGLLPYFSNMLPEGRLRDYLADRAGIKPEREFFLLWALGQDLPGAVSVRATSGEPEPNWRSVNLSDAELSDAQLKFSLAGVQLKFSAISSVRKGVTIPVHGSGGDWIAKLPSLEFEGVSENEFSMMSLAHGIGIHVPEVRLIDVRDIQNLPAGLPEFKGQAYLIRRYDRITDGGKMHQEDFAQIFGLRPAEKYRNVSYRRIAAKLAQKGSELDIRQFVRRLVFSALIGNADMHAKNWSVVYPDRRNAALAPAYDLVSTIAYTPDDKMALKVSRTARFDEFDLDELAHLAGKALLPEKLVLDVAKETVMRFREAWAAEKSHLPFTSRVRDTIDKHLTRIPLYKEV